MPEITEDPFTVAYNAIWDTLVASPDFTADVKVGNRIVYTSVTENRDPDKMETITDDFPETRFIASGFTPHIQRTSNSSSVVCRYSVEIRSGTKALDVAHFPLVWAVYRALSQWEKILTELTWNCGERFIILARPVGDVVEDIERGEVSRGVEGWFAIWTVEVTMFFSTSALEVPGNPTGG